MTSFKVSILLTVIFFISKRSVKGDITSLIESVDSEFADFNVAMQYGQHEGGYFLFQNYVNTLFVEDEENKSSEEISYISVIPLDMVKCIQITKFLYEIISNNINCFPQVVLTPSQFCQKYYVTATSGERKLGKGQSSSSRSFRSTQSATSGERKLGKGQSSSSRSLEVLNVNDILQAGVYTEDDQYRNAVNSYSIYSGTIGDPLNNTVVANWPKYALAYYQFHIAQYYTKNEYSQFNYAKWCETSVQTFFKVEPFLPEEDRRQNYQE
ncbi:hypothetical protein AGLY_009349 [Aphis glycines]|uniref:Uncharacterized protein n=1 Tax=Aphis glycines TaxID=307491 RepID=A0A6G0THT1_APHGL|nr:hypothetical protein AGLY_009349 [Aphis glycines]